MKFPVPPGCRWSVPLWPALDRPVCLPPWRWLKRLRPLVLERGQPAAVRRQLVETFWQTGQLNSQCNVQFGEGGAGTFSDGKLNTGTHDFRNRWVLEQFVQCGAQAQILYDAKPHIGTDVLLTVVMNLRQRIEALGGEVRFQSRLTGFGCPGNTLSSITWEEPSGMERMPCRRLILATGHSARDTFSMLLPPASPWSRNPLPWVFALNTYRLRLTRRNMVSSTPHCRRLIISCFIT